ncbi:hypothetical protein Bca4012_025629 [Brassica carinata]
MGVKILAWRSVVAREVYFQSQVVKGRSFLDVDDVCCWFLSSIRVCFSFEFLYLLVFSLALCLRVCTLCSFWIVLYLSYNGSQILSRLRSWSLRVVVCGELLKVSVVKKSWFQVTSESQVLRRPSLALPIIVSSGLSWSLDFLGGFLVLKQ